ncbi:uncharacterized protein LOC134824895 [Bolinopsis microptera]|uniref:uncharacterized protein LOC134824895 n=1 Tax=Bolinopsis microptera TaxID=2820187 RepID=UPI003079DD9E
MSEVDNYISRCIVCESIYSLVIVHSDDDQPSCPEDQIVVTPEGKEEYLEYEVACHPGDENRRVPSKAAPYGQDCQDADTPWYGYSFWQISDGNFGLGVTSESAAACLTKFSMLPIVKCKEMAPGREMCTISKDSTVKSYWQMKEGEESEINNIEFYDSERFFKRCAVCRRPEAKKLVLQGSSWSFESKKRV